ncbi:MAG: efflux transporter outer membrane subunit [Pseudomonadota bacterium]
MINRATVLVMLAATALGGCNFAPRHQRPVGAIPAVLPQGGAYPAMLADGSDLSAIAWNEFFTDTRLRQVIALGLENNRDLRVAAANVLQARAQYRVQRSNLLPTVSVGGSAQVGDARGVSATTGSGIPASGQTVEIYQANVGISAFELDLWGRLRNLNEAALQEFFATEEAQRAARISLIAELASAWLTLAADRDLLLIANDTLQSTRQSLDLTRAQFRVGVISELEVRQADTNYQAARNDIAALRAQIEQDRNALNLLAGAPVADALLPEGLGTQDYTLSQLPGDLGSAVLLRRPDVRRAERELIARNADIGAARAAMFPTISLTASFGTVSTALSGLFGSDSRAWSVGPGATLPIFDFGRRSGNLAAARAAQQGAVATYERTLQAAFRDVADALATRGTIDEQLAARAARADSAIVAARLSDARYRAGVESFLITLDAQRTAYAARRDLVTTRLNRANNLVSVYRAIGGGLS